MNGLELFKWRAFSALEKMAHLRKGSQQPSVTAFEPLEELQGDATDRLWVFCSTIGELHACKSLLDRLYQTHALVLITDRDCYRESYQQHYPGAVVVQLEAGDSDISELLQRLPPAKLIVCEIPALPHDAPCRLSYGFLRRVKNSGANIHLVNGWLYSYPPSCRMDWIERRLFSRDYLQLFDHLSVQTAEVKAALIMAGADVRKISVTGNMKFDALLDEGIQNLNEKTGAVIESLALGPRKVLVAGCLASLEESSRLMIALRALKQRMPDLFIVIAPRHPENAAFMATFIGLLNDSGLAYSFRSTMQPGSLETSELLVLDTFGELKAFYAVADLCYVGCNHNILEPLSFGKTTLTSGDWDPQFPSYPVYQQAKASGLVQDVGTEPELSELLFRLLTTEPDHDKAEVGLVLSRLSGATEVNYRIIEQAC